MNFLELMWAYLVLMFHCKQQLSYMIFLSKKKICILENYTWNLKFIIKKSKGYTELTEKLTRKLEQTLEIENLINRHTLLKLKLDILLLCSIPSYISPICIPLDQRSFPTSSKPLKICNWSKPFKLNFGAKSLHV